MAQTRAPHIVNVPHPLFLVIRIFQIIFAVCLLGLLAYVAWVISGLTSYYGTSVASGAVGVGLFSVCLTLILGAYYLISYQCAPHLYNWVAIIVLESAAVLFWLITFALLADITAALVSYNAVVSSSSDYYYYDSSDYDYSDYSYVKRLELESGVEKRGLVKRTVVNPAAAIIYTSFALSIIEWILFIVSLIILSIRIHRHRRANYPMKNGSDGVEEACASKHMEGETQPMPAPEYQGQMPVQHQQGFVQQPMH